MIIARTLANLILLLAATFISSVAFCSTELSPSEFKCKDFLGELHKKPPHVIFIKCEGENFRQGKPLKATYRVRGFYAARTEAFFARHANMPHLKKSCCQWDGPPGQFTGKDGRTYAIYMASSETNVKSRKQWRTINSFQIVAEILTEDI